MWPVLLSSIRPARRHASQLTAVLGSNNLIGSRGYASNDSGNCCAEVRRHLYVVLDDHEDGFGVHKLDLRDNDDGELDRGTARCLPEPPALLVTLPTLGTRVQFSAVGTSIVAIGDTIVSPVMDGCWVPDDIGGVLIYDTKTAALTVVPHLPAGLMRGYKAAMAAGNNLYMLGTQPPWRKRDWDGGGSLHCLTADSVGTGGSKFWGWERLSASSPWCWSNFRRPPVLPFFAKYITAHGVHRSSPGATEQQQILVSLRPSKTSRLGATFSFGTTSMEWTQHGEWHLPVIGQACYDDQLNAWVGLHAVNDGDIHGSLVTDGHIFIGNASSQSDWNVISKEKLFRLDEDVAAGWKHVDAMLVSMASAKGHSEYCLMERLRREEDEEETEQEEETDQEEDEQEEEEDDEQCWDDGSKCLLRLASLRVEPGRDGEPMITTRWPVRSYEVSRHNRRFHAQAFWM